MTKQKYKLFGIFHLTDLIFTLETGGRVSPEIQKISKIFKQFACNSEKYPYFCISCQSNTSCPQYRMRMEKCREMMTATYCLYASSFSAEDVVAKVLLKYGDTNYPITTIDSGGGNRTSFNDSLSIFR